MRARHGSQAVEVALLLPVLILVLAGVVDFAHYLIVADGVVAAVGEGARAGAASAVDEEPTEVAARVAQIAWANAGLPGGLTVVAAVQGDAPDQWIVVEGSVAHDAWFGFVGMPSAVGYRATVRLVNQRD